MTSKVPVSFLDCRRCDCALSGASHPHPLCSRSPIADLPGGLQHPDFSKQRATGASEPQYAAPRRIQIPPPDRDALPPGRKHRPRRHGHRPEAAALPDVDTKPASGRPTPDRCDTRRHRRASVLPTAAADSAMVTYPLVSRHRSSATSARAAGPTPCALDGQSAPLPVYSIASDVRELPCRDASRSATAAARKS